MLLPILPLPGVVDFPLPPLRQQMLLAEPLVARAAAFAGVLKSRARMLDALRPYRHLAAEPGLR